MSHLSVFSDAGDQIRRLTKGRKQGPYQVLEVFCSDNNMSELKQFFQEVGETCLTSDRYPFCKGGKRASLLYYHKQIETVLEAVFAYVNQQKEESLEYEEIHRPL